jgi:bifunctional non-homologous end joining protein LigD
LAAERGDLSEYRRKRSFDSTSEPAGADVEPGEGARFVIQRHHARRLHWDLRLEHDGVLVSWALPRGVPLHPELDRLAVHTEDHPLEYIDFHGTIPAGQYGAGEMSIWDSGTYEAEKFEDSKVVARFAGERVQGRYALFRTRGDDWMIHRMDPPPPEWEPMPDRVEPLEPRDGGLPRGEGRAFEIWWQGERAMAHCETGHLRLLDCGGDEITKRFREVGKIVEDLGGTEALLDGVVVAFGEDGRPDPERIARRAQAQSDSTIRRLQRDAPATYVIFDLLHLDGRPLIDEPYERRRALLEELGLQGDAWQVPGFHRGDGKAVLEAARAQGLPGIVAKPLDSPYRQRSRGGWTRISA